MPSSTSFLLLVLCVLVLVPSVSAFGAGEIPDFAYLNGQCQLSLSIKSGDVSLGALCQPWQLPHKRKY